MRPPYALPAAVALLMLLGAGGPLPAQMATGSPGASPAAEAIFSPDPVALPPLPSVDTLRSPDPPALAPADSVLRPDGHQDDQRDRVIVPTAPP